MRLITRLFAWVCGIVLGLVALLFVIGSREPVTLAVWGIPDTIEVPLFLAVLAAAVIGFFFGAVVMWFSNGRSRRLGRAYLAELHQVRVENDELRRELAAMRQAADAADQSRSRSSSDYDRIGAANNNQNMPLLPGRAL